MPIFLGILTYEKKSSKLDCEIRFANSYINVEISYTRTKCLRHYVRKNLRFFHSLKEFPIVQERFALQTVEVLGVPLISGATLELLLVLLTYHNLLLRKLRHIRMFSR